ncbi:hypothetical protein NN561_003420 [Cricetulus griseus]
MTAVASHPTERERAWRGESADGKGWEERGWRLAPSPNYLDGFPSIRFPVGDLLRFFSSSPPSFPPLWGAPVPELLEARSRSRPVSVGRAEGPVSWL